MSAFSNKDKIIKIFFGLVFIVIVVQLINLQLVSKKYKILADSNAIYRKVEYPDRGIIFDRKKRPLLENINMFDLMVTPADAKGVDTLALCQLLKIDTAAYKRKMKELIFKYTAVKPSPFEAILSNEMYARLNENIYKFPGFFLQERSVRSYPYNVGASMLGYIAEVDVNYLNKNAGTNYEMGDYAGFTGLERSYEKVLMGQRGVKRLIRDNKSRLLGAYAKGDFDSAAVAGKNLFTSIDVELQILGEKLMTNKVGSIVAIDPQTGGILCMVSAPTYNPNYLTGNQRTKHYQELVKDPRLPLYNRSLSSRYSPGSTFKTLVGIIGLAEGVINESFSVTCTGAYWGCGTGKPKCLDLGTYKLETAIAHSCNTYFATVFRKTLDQPRFNGSASEGLDLFNAYAASFGLGKKIGVDLPFENKGNLPTATYYEKVFGKKWHSCNIISNAIGQGEVQTTILQLANVMATIANKGYYYAPHIVDSVEENEDETLLIPYKEKHYTKNINDSIFDAVQDGMQSVMDYGTGSSFKVEGITICGKTGTVENYAIVNGKREKQKNHSFFGAFAPRQNPKIAIAVICENAGFGATYSGPIASLMIEKYLKDSIRTEYRKALAERMIKTDLIPPIIKEKMQKLSIEPDKVDWEVSMIPTVEEENISLDSTLLAPNINNDLETPSLPNKPNIPTKPQTDALPADSNLRKKYPPTKND